MIVQCCQNLRVFSDRSTDRSDWTARLCLRTFDRSAHSNREQDYLPNNPREIPAIESSISPSTRPALKDRRERLFRTTCFTSQSGSALTVVGVLMFSRTAFCPIDRGTRLTCLPVLTRKIACRKQLHLPESGHPTSRGIAWSPCKHWSNVGESLASGALCIVCASRSFLRVASPCGNIAR